MTRTKAKPGPPLRPASDATATHEDRMTPTTIPEALDDDLILRGDALAIFQPENSMSRRRICDAIRALAAQPAQAALDRLIRDAEIRGQAKAEAIFATSGAEQAYIDADAVACPACGGSGHQDDAQAALARRDAEVREPLEKRIAALTRERDDARLFLDNAVSKAPEPLKELGAWLADRLDEDDWPTVERLLNAAALSLIGGAA